VSVRNAWNSSAVTIPVSGTSSAITVAEGVTDACALVTVGVSAQIEISSDLANWYPYGASLTAHVALPLPQVTRGVRAVGGITSTGSLRVAGLYTR